MFLSWLFSSLAFISFLAGSTVQYMLFLACYREAVHLLALVITSRAFFHSLQLDIYFTWKAALTRTCVLSFRSRHTGGFIFPCAGQIYTDFGIYVPD